MKYTKDDILRMIEEEDVEFIRLQFTDVFGTMKNVAITASQIEKALNNQFSFDARAIEGYVTPAETELYLHPDLDTFVVFPWRPQQGKVARFICDVYNSDGTPFEADGRQVLKKVVKEAEKMGYKFLAGPELEFFLFHTDDNGNPTTITHEHAGYFDVGPVDLGENARRDIILNLEDMGFEIESSHHEGAPGQHEIDFKYSDAVNTADNVMTYKMTVKSVAKRHGLHATFMPKPRGDVNGSGMHINMSLMKDEKNVFSDPDGKCGLSKEAYWFMAGILKHSKSISLLTNPLINSYKRLVPGYEAPMYIGWSDIDPLTIFRVSAKRDNNAIIELRSPDPSSNPYLVLAVCLAAGLDGIKNQIECPEKISASLEKLRPEEISALGIDRLPHNLSEALDLFVNDKFIVDILGQSIVEKCIQFKKNEWTEYMCNVTEWEVEKYLYRY